MNIYRGFILLIIWLASDPSVALPQWPEAIRGDWKSAYTPEPLPPFCRMKQLSRTYAKYHADIPGLNHFCNAKVKHHICLKYYKKDRTNCLLYLARDAEDAIQGANQKSPNHPLLPYLHTEYGSFLLEAGDHEQAVQEYLKAIRKNKRYLPAYIKLANAFIKANQYDEAEKTLQHALNIQKNKRHETYIRNKLNKVHELKHKQAKQ